MMRGTTLIRLRRILTSATNRDERNESGVAMLTAILFMIIMAGISSIVLGVVTTQMTPTFIDQKGTKTIYSAQAGIQSALSLLRAAGTPDVTNTVYGDPTKLPCSFSGYPNGASDGNGYTVTIQYFLVDPTPFTTQAQRNANAMTCTTGAATQYGVSGQYGLSATPKYALITSSGTATQINTTAANRSITALYTFQVSNVNVLGGVIYNSGSTACMQAVTAGVGSPIGFVAAASCGPTSANSALQLFSYTNNYQLVLASTAVNGNPGLCITGPVLAGQATQNATLQTCRTSTDAARWNQLWSWTGSYTWEGENQAITGPNSSSWLSPNVADGASPVGHYLQVATSTLGTMAPTSQVGAGAAKYTTHQLVNYLEFGRCADVTNEQLSSTAMISYPCKQDPTGGTTYITWNQKWYYCEAGDTTSTCSTVNPLAQQIYVDYTDDPNQKWCLTTPTSPGGGIYPVFQTCATAGTPLARQQTWARYYDTGTYGTSYVIEDEYGRCLTADENHYFSGNISELTAIGCNGQDSQKWNAPPTYQQGNIGGYRELSGG